VNVSTEPMSLEHVEKKFLADAEARNLRPATLYKYRLVLKQLKEFGDKRGLFLIANFDVDALRDFRVSWKNKNLSASKKLGHLKTFFQFCIDSGYIRDNPTRAIKSPKIEDPPVLPLSDDEMKKILTACNTHPDAERGTQLKALVLLMRYSGLRIGDTCTLHRNRIDGKGMLDLYTAKSGTKVRLPVNPVALKALKRVPQTNDYFFWNGTSTRKTCTNIWQDEFSKMCARAGIKAHSHQLRHAFAVDLLQHGVSMENVSLLLGHRRISITERFYANFTLGRQKSLEADVRKTW